MENFETFCVIFRFIPTIYAALMLHALHIAKNFARNIKEVMVEPYRTLS